MDKGLIYVAVLCCALLGAVGQLCLKQGSDLIDFSRLLSIANKWLIFGVFLYGIAFIGYTVALKYGQLNVLYSLIASSYIWVMILSGLVLKENITSLKLLGSLLIVIGVGFIAQ